MQNIANTFRDSFSPLSNRNLRVYLGGQVISLAGTFLQATAQAWVVWKLTSSTAALGTVAMLGSLPILFLGPWAGVWADRLDRRRVLIGTQVAAMLLAFILAILVQTNALELWHVYVLSALLGVVTAFDIPSQQAFIGDLSGMGEVRKAVVLNAMIIQISRIFGPAFAGLIIAAFGVAVAFWLNGISFIAVIISLLLVRSQQAHKGAYGNPLAEFVEGLQFIRTQPRIQDMLLFVIFVTFFSFSIIVNLLPAVTTDVLHGGPEILGVLNAASGVGALLGTLFIVPFAQSQKRIGVVMGIIIVWMGLWYLAFAVSTWLPLSLVCLFFVSAGSPTVFTTANGMLQFLAPPTMRARLMSTFVIVSFGFQPFSALYVGFMAEPTHLGTPATIALNGLLMMVGAVGLLLLRADLRRWEVEYRPSGQFQRVKTDGETPELAVIPTDI